METVSSGAAAVLRGRTLALGGGLLVLGGALLVLGGGLLALLGGWALERALCRSWDIRGPDVDVSFKSRSFASLSRPGYVSSYRED